MPGDARLCRRGRSAEAGGDRRRDAARRRAVDGRGARQRRVRVGARDVRTQSSAGVADASGAAGAGGAAGIEWAGEAGGNGKGEGDRNEPGEGRMSELEAIQPEPTERIRRGGEGVI